jgi:hypothetical protein
MTLSVRPGRPDSQRPDDAFRGAPEPRAKPVKRDCGAEKPAGFALAVGLTIPLESRQAGADAPLRGRSRGGLAFGALPRPARRLLAAWRWPWTRLEPATRRAAPVAPRTALSEGAARARYLSDRNQAVLEICLISAGPWCP